MGGGGQKICMSTSRRVRPLVLRVDLPCRAPSVLSLPPSSNVRIPYATSGRCSLLASVCDSTVEKTKTYALFLIFFLYLCLLLCSTVCKGKKRLEEGNGKHYQEMRGDPETGQECACRFVFPSFRPFLFLCALSCLLSSIFFGNYARASFCSSFLCIDSSLTRN